MQISARNQLKGKIKDVKKGPVSAEVTLELAGGEILTAVITASAAERLALSSGKDAYAVIKASSIMLGID